jgi:integrase
MHEIPSSSRLYYLTPLDFTFPNFVDSDGSLRTIPAENIPTVLWPDGRWCHAANTFIRQRFEKGNSRRNYGGSLAVAAQNIGHLVRFCWRRRIDFIDLSDNQFREFMYSLMPVAADDRSNKAARDRTQVVSIGRTCLAFLRCVGEQANDDAFLGSSGRIRTIETTVRLHRGKGAARTVTQVSHSSFPTMSPAKRRHPISQSTISALREVASRTTNPHVRARRQALITLLDSTGARRGELADLTVKSVREAGGLSPPMLAMTTLKRGTPERLVPISPADLYFIRSYVQYYRMPLMKRFGKRDRDHGMLFVSARDGSPLGAGALGAEIYELGKLAGCTDATCHRFRHRFITKLFVSLIKHHQIANPDQFRQMLICGEALKQKIIQWTGHRSIASLEHYIDLAFAEIVNLPVIYDWARVNLALDSFMSTTIVLEGDLRSAGLPEARIALFKEAVSSLKIEVERAASHERGQTDVEK